MTADRLSGRLYLNLLVGLYILVNPPQNLGLDIAVLRKVRYALCPMPYALCTSEHVTKKGYMTNG